MSTQSANKNSKKFPPIFWVAFIALILFNISVFFDYSKPIDRYAKFAKIEHLVMIKAGSVLHQVMRNGLQLEQCKLLGDSQLKWLRVEGNFAVYTVKTLAVEAAVKDSDCLAGDIVKVDFTSDNEANTVLVLLSLDFDDPFKGAAITK